MTNKDSEELLSIDGMLKIFPDHILNAVGAYSRQGFDFSRRIFSDPLTERPDKLYAASARVPLYAESKPVGHMSIVVLRPGDATGGNGSNYSLDIVTIAEHLKGVNDVQGVLPRVKDCFVEGFFPLFTWHLGECLYHIACLKQVSSYDREGEKTLIDRQWYLGDAPKVFRHMVREVRRGHDIPTVQLTCGYKRNGRQFGNPHVVVASRNISDLEDIRNKIIQVVGFVSVHEKDNSLCDYLEEYGVVPRNE